MDNMMDMSTCVYVCINVCVCVFQDLGVDSSPDCSLWTQQHVPVDIISKSVHYGGHLPVFGYQMDQNRQNKEKGIYFSTQILLTQRLMNSKISHKPLRDNNLNILVTLCPSFSLQYSFLAFSFLLYPLFGHCFLSCLLQKILHFLHVFFL